jgi:hypothetical protein
VRPDFPTDGEGLPLLAEIPRERWGEALKPLPHRLRRQVVTQQRAGLEGIALVARLELEDPVPGLVTPRPPSAPVAGRADRRQVNLKLEADQHERLRQAARTLGLAPTQLARLLVLRGVDEMLRSS